MSSTDQPGPPAARYSIIGTILMFPIGAVIAFVLVYILVLRGTYYPGEFLLFFVLIFAVLFVIRLQFRRSRQKYWRQRWQGDESVRILRERYARGEITADQFHQMLRELRQSAVRPREDDESS